MIYKDSYKNIDATEINIELTLKEIYNNFDINNYKG